MAYRDHTRKVSIGGRVIGGGSPVAIQSMTNTPTENIEATTAQISSGGGEGVEGDQKADRDTAGSGYPFRL